MPRPSPHHLALFSLVPEPGNKRAERVISHPDNDHLTSISSDGVLVIDVGFHIRGKSSKTLATLGRGVDSDIYVEGSSIAKIQCSFEIDLDTGVVMFCDKSFAKSTQVFGENAMSFEHERIRKVLVQKGLNTIIGMGGERRNLVQFKLEWHQDPKQAAETIKKYEALPYGQVENPRLARTVDEAPTDLPSRRETRAHTPGQRQLKMRYVKVQDNKLGSGQFGVVYKALDVDSGKLMAVKIMQRPARISKQVEWRRALQYALKREVEILSEISHPHIVDYIASQGWDELQVEIFMGLKEGTLESLVESGADDSSVANFVFPQMLQALDCVAWHGIIHRDVKPENILYISQPGGAYQFQLGDFGLCNRAVDATTFAGSQLYMAPEMFQKGGQTSKLDVWSLFVTILWTLNVGEFRQKWHQFKSAVDAQEAVMIAASKGDMSRIREMAVVEPEERASAAQMLVKCYNAVGLSTPRNQVPALTTRPIPAIVASKLPVPARPGLTTRTGQRKPKALPKTTNIFAGAAQYRVEKFRDPVQAQPLRRLQDLRLPNEKKSTFQVIDVAQVPGQNPSDH